MSDKRISSTPLAKKLYERRRLLKITLDELSEKTGIPIKYLKRIEKGEWEKLPSEVYAKGFLKNYARTVGTNSDQVIKQYEQEIAEAKSSGEKEEKVKEKRKFKLSFWAQDYFSPSTIRISLVVVVLVLVLGYIGYQFRVILQEPKISVFSPQDLETIVTGDNIVLSGKLETSADVFLNNQVIAIKADGTFEETLELLPGLNVFELKAISRFNKENIIIRRIIYNTN